MPLYHTSTNPAAMAQAAMNSATQAAASQQKRTTTTTKGDFWDDLYKGARAVSGIMGAADDAMGMYDKLRTRNAYDDVSKLFGEGGFEAIQNNPDMQDYWHSQALGQFVKDRASNQKGYTDMLKSMDESADRLYQNWRMQAMGVRDAWQSGDMRSFMPMMSELVANSPLPYRLEDNGNGVFRVMFRSDRHGGWTDTGRTLSPEEAFTEMNNVLRGEQMVLRGADMKTLPMNMAFNEAARRSYWGTMMGNAENRLDPKKQIPLYDARGRMAGIGVIQNPLNDYNAGPQLVVFGRNGRQMGVFDGYADAMRAGLSPIKPEKTASSESAGQPGPGSAAHIAMLNAGYVWDKNQKWYFKAGADADGKPQADYSQPASYEVYRVTALRNGGAVGGIREDPSAGLFDDADQTADQRRPDPPSIPDKPDPLPVSQNLSSLKVDGNTEVVRIRTYPDEQWAVIGEDGQPIPVSREEAERIYAMKDAMEKAEAAKRGPLFSLPRRRENADGSMSLVRVQ